MVWVFQFEDDADAWMERDSTAELKGELDNFALFSGTTRFEFAHSNAKLN